MELTNRQWELIEPLFPRLPRRPDGRGRPWRGNREVLEGILWVLQSGARWKDLPHSYPPYQTCHRRFQQWTRTGVFDRILSRLASDLDFSEAFVDASFVPAKKGDLWSDRPSGEKERRFRQWRAIGVSRALSALQRHLRMNSPSLAIP